MYRTILHCDCNSFYASVECVLNPELKKVPMAVCGNPENRHGIILAKNEIAKKYKIKTAQTIWEAKKLCPKLVLVPPHHEEYYKYSKLTNEIYERFTDMVEPFSIDESWLDVTGTTHLFGNGKQIADKIRETVKKELGITISVGVSFNKIFAKLGSDYKKPDATTVISRENYKDIVFPLPVSELLFVGKTVTSVLSRLHINTIGDLAKSDKRIISSKLGKMGETIHDWANGIDEEPVKSAYDKRDIKSIGNGMTFKRNLIGLQDIKLGVNVLSDTVASRMRKHGVKCYTVQVMIKDPNFKTISKQKTLDRPTQLARKLSNIAIAIIKERWDLEAPIRSITITGTNLIPEGVAGEQLSLFENADSKKIKKQKNLENTMDNIRDKFGNNAISFASTVKNDLGIKENSCE